MKKPFAVLEKDLGYHFTDPECLLEALQHSSYVNERLDVKLKDNERFEFLGDAVLDLVITHMLMGQFPDTCEGDLSRMRALIVNESQLADIAHSLRLGDYILLGKGEAQSHGERKSSILADALEALMAAVYLDGGFRAAFAVIERHFSLAVSQVGKRLAVEDFKSQLQEYVQGKYKLVPCYRVVRETGPDHDKTFEVSLGVGDFLTTFGIGKSKKAAEQNAACTALEKLQERSE